MKKNPKRYREWKQQVYRAAAASWPKATPPIHGEDVAVAVTNYYTLAPPDIDNILKPILDSMEHLVYYNDNQVYRVTSVKHNLAEPVRDPSPAVAAGLALYSELVHVLVDWNGD